MLRINIMLCSIIILSACSKITSNKEIYKTVVGFPDLEIYSAVPFKGDQIGVIPFKEKVEIIENKITDGYIKVKYKKTIGYVLSEYLSDRDDVPFVDDIKYDYELNEFDCDRDSIIKAAISTMHKDGYFYAEPQYFYTENPQIFTLYGKNCNGFEVKRIAVIMVSKLHPNFNSTICFELEDNKLSSAFGGTFFTIKELIEFVRRPAEYCDD